ncbi:hypothetical protein ACJX0J_028975, partial [Zea mays]
MDSIWWKKHTEHVIISFIFYYKRQECSMVLLLMDAHHSIGIQPSKYESVEFYMNLLFFQNKTNTTTQ